jgi:hypothetical protein
VDLPGGNARGDVVISYALKLSTTSGTNKKLYLVEESDLV